MKTLAEQIFEGKPNVSTEKELLGLGFELMRQQQGLKSARYYFWYHEDFPADFVSEYFWMQRHVRIGVDQ